MRLEAETKAAEAALATKLEKEFDESDNEDLLEANLCLHVAALALVVQYSVISTVHKLHLRSKLPR